MRQERREACDKLVTNKATGGCVVVCDNGKRTRKTRQEQGKEQGRKRREKRRKGGGECHRRRLDAGGAVQEEVWAHERLTSIWKGAGEQPTARRFGVTCRGRLWKAVKGSHSGGPQERPRGVRGKTQGARNRTKRERQEGNKDEGGERSKQTRTVGGSCATLQGVCGWM